MEFENEQYFMEELSSSEHPKSLEEPTMHPLVVLMVTAALVFLCAILGLLMIMGLGLVYGLDFQDALRNLSEASESTRNFVRSALAINHLTMFVIPGLLAAWWCYRASWFDYLQIREKPTLLNVLMATFFMLLTFPVAQYAYWLNKQIPLPDALKSMEDSTQEAIEGLLVTNYPYEMIINVIIVALIPAIGEEIIFRGFLQKQVMRLVKNPIMGIWLAAAIFSAGHFQFEGFLARMILGAALGYLYYWTRNLWVPITAHFLNNALQVVMQYFYKQQMSSIDIDKMDEVPLYAVVMALIGLFALGYQLKKHNEATKDSESLPSQI